MSEETTEVEKDVHVERGGGDADRQNEDESTEVDKQKGPGLFEQPLLVEGKRERKKTDRLTAATIEAEPKKKKEVVFVDGGGTALGEIPYIAAMLNKFRAEDLNILHRALFDANATYTKVKQNIRKFNGFDFDKESKEYLKREDLLTRAYWPVIQKQFIKCLGVDKAKGDKAETVKAVLEFLLKPHDHGRKVPSKKKAKSKKRKRSSSTSKKDPSKKKTKKEGEGAEGEGTEGDEVADLSSSSDEDEEDQGDSGAESGGESGKEASPKKTPPKKEKKKTEKSEKSAKKEKQKKSPAAKKATPKKTDLAKKKTLQKKKATTKKDVPVDLSTDTTMSDSDDEPLVKKAKVPPTDTQLKESIKKILDGANLEEVTMKTVCQAVYSKFPDFDLTSRKDFIKSTVKELIN